MDFAALARARERARSRHRSNNTNDRSSESESDVSPTHAAESSAWTDEQADAHLLQLGSALGFRRAALLQRVKEAVLGSRSSVAPTSTIATAAAAATAIAKKPKRKKSKRKPGARGGKSAASGDAAGGGGGRYSAGSSATDNKRSFMTSDQFEQFMRDSLGEFVDAQEAERLEGFTGAELEWQWLKNCYRESWDKFCQSSAESPVGCVGKVRANPKWTNIEEGPCGQKIRFEGGMRDGDEEQGIRTDTKNFQLDHTVEFATIIDAWYDAHKRTQEFPQYSLDVSSLMHFLMSVQDSEKHGPANLVVRCSRCHTRGIHVASPTLGPHLDFVLPNISPMTPYDNSRSNDDAESSVHVRSDPNAPLSVVEPVPDLTFQDNGIERPLRIVEQVGNTATTGFKVWSGALGLLSYLRKSGEARKWRARCEGNNTVTILELGSGTGTLGLGCAALGMASQVVLTDVGVGCDILARNLKENQTKPAVSVDPERAAGHVGKCRVSVREFDWGNLGQLESLKQAHARPSMIVGSDVVYSMHAVGPLNNALLQLSTTATSIFIALEVRDALVFDVWINQARKFFTVKRIPSSKVADEHREFVHVYSLSKKS